MTQDQTVSRRRTFEWTDPAVTAELLATMSGLDYLTGMAQGRCPLFPAGILIGLGEAHFAFGTARVSLDPAEYHCNPMGTMHGGVLATLLDCVLGPAALSTLPAGRGHTTLSMELKFTRAVKPETGRLTAVGEIVTNGRRIITTEGRVIDAGGRIYATGTSTLMVFDQPARNHEAAAIHTVQREGTSC